MNKKFHTSTLALLTMALAAVVFVNLSTEQKATAEAMTPAATYMLASLPASDAVIFIDAQRLLTDSIPGVLANNPTLLARVNQKIDQFKEKTNVDLRTFDSVAIGVRFTAPAKNEDFKIIVLTQGRFDANSVLDSALATAKREGIHPQERLLDGRTIYVLSRRQPEAELEKTTTNQKETADKHDMAVAVFDANTFVFGNLESVRAGLDVSAERVSNELVQLATRTPNAIVGFSGNVPAFVKEKLSRDKETLAKTFAAIHQVYGSIVTAGSDAESTVTLRAENADQAGEISKAVNALKMLTGLNKNRASTGEMRSISELIRNLTVTSEGNEVFLNLKLGQADITSLLRNF